MLLTALAARHRAHRPDRHRLDHLQRAVQPGPPVRLAGPHQRRPGRLEHRHHRRPRRRPQLQPRRPARARGALRAGRRVPRGRARKLWDSWEDDAVARRQGSRRLGRRRRRSTRPAHDGRYFRVAGRSTCRARRRATRCWCRPARRRTASDFAAATPRRCSPPSRRSRTRRRSTPTSRRPTAAAGRDPDHVKILPGIVPVIGATEAEARALGAELDGLHRARVRAAAARRRPRRRPADRSTWTRRCPPTCRPRSEIEGAKSRYTLIVELARRERLTVRQISRRLGGGRGHLTFAGTPEQVADAIEEWSPTAPPTASTSCRRCCPSGLEAFVDHVVPILQERGLFRTEYEGTHPARPLRPADPGAIRRGAGTHGLTTAMHESDTVHSRTAVVVGNPKPGWRTLAAAVHVIRELDGGEPGLVADLGDVGSGAARLAGPDCRRPGGSGRCGRPGRGRQSDVQGHLHGVAQAVSRSLHHRRPPPGRRCR